MSGGRIVCCSILSNVVLVAGAGNGGGGVRMSGGQLVSCLVANDRVVDTASASGGGVHMTGGGVVNCTIAGNSSATTGGVGGVFMTAGTLTNCIVYLNTDATGAAINVRGTVTNYSYSCAPELADGVNGNLTADPVFQSSSSVNYRLKFGSPCTDKGAQLAWMTGARDLDDRKRVIGPKPDMGAYEIWPPPKGVAFFVQ